MIWLEWHMLTVTHFSCPEDVTVSGESLEQLLFSFFRPNLMRIL